MFISFRFLFSLSLSRRRLFFSFFHSSSPFLVFQVGRYIIASTTCQYNDPENIFDIPCDLVFPCAQMNSIKAEDVKKLADNGCEGIIEGGHCSVDSDARKEMKKVRVRVFTRERGGRKKVEGD